MKQINKYNLVKRKNPKTESDFIQREIVKNMFKNCKVGILVKWYLKNVKIQTKFVWKYIE